MIEILQLLLTLLFICLILLGTVILGVLIALRIQEYRESKLIEKAKYQLLFDEKGQLQKIDRLEKFEIDTEK